MKRKTSVAVAAGVAALAVAAATVVRLRSRPRFDMVAELAAIADREGVWDNQWDQNREKISSLSADLLKESIYLTFRN